MPSFLPSLSSNGPTPSEARISPSACAKAIVPFWLGERWNRSDSSGRMVPSMAAIIPYTKIARMAARINTRWRSFQMLLFRRRYLGPRSRPMAPEHGVEDGQLPQAIGELRIFGRIAVRRSKRRSGGISA